MQVLPSFSSAVATVLTVRGQVVKDGLQEGVQRGTGRAVSEPTFAQESYHPPQPSGENIVVIH